MRRTSHYILNMHLPQRVFSSAMSRYLVVVFGVIVNHWEKVVLGAGILGLLCSLVLVCHLCTKGVSGHPNGWHTEQFSNLIRTLNVFPPFITLVTLWTHSLYWRCPRSSPSAGSSPHRLGWSWSPDPPAQTLAAPADSAYSPVTTLGASGHDWSYQQALWHCRWVCWFHRCRGNCCSPLHRSRPPVWGLVWSGSPTWSRCWCMNSLPGMSCLEIHGEYKYYRKKSRLGCSSS